MCNTGRPLNLHFPHIRQSAEATKIKKKKNSSCSKNKTYKLKLLLEQNLVLE